jgi:hypothetical protein
MLFNGAKCHILHLGAKNAKFEYTMAGTKLEAVEYEKDVGVLVHQSMKPSMQCARTNAILGQLSRAITFRDKNTVLRTYGPSWSTQLCAGLPGRWGTRRFCSYRGVLRASRIQGWQVLTRDIETRKIVLVSSNHFFFIPLQRVQN